MALTDSRLVIFNVSQHNLQRCTEKCETGIRSSRPPEFLQVGLLCLLRKTTRPIRGENTKTKEYGIVGLYRIQEILRQNPTNQVSGWIPQDGWTFIVKLKEVTKLPAVFREEFTIDTQVPGHKESKLVKGLFNRDLQTSAKFIEGPTAINYIKAIEKKYPLIFQAKQEIDANLPDIQEFLKEEQERKKETCKFNEAQLMERISKLPEYALRKSATTSVYVRSVDVARLVQIRAKGICELCKQQAPFKDKEGEPFLEEHHIIWLSNGGKDIISNAVALCPNCHRKMHILDLEEDITKLLTIAETK